ncbi:DUF2924 domain-containing protein [Sandarakinorhabdus sp.]|jgi:hypothetical protein|uniref:DUF2924 domain-containing protein n=1 Tax=Sandarakinorhabdus sp. TaxID=1916663 RepID=UPI0028AF4CC8|nr:DUF2924 domain-containing protein [Sandarakinorhabdus sp.]
MADITDQLAALAAMSPAQLRAEWRRVYRASPARLTPDLLLRGIAFRVQERSLGGLSAAFGSLLDRTARQLERSENADPRVNREQRLKPGTRLVRSWNGKTYSVLVTDDGYSLGDQQFSSLTQVAAAITGAHWSGPRFFGVRAGRTTTGAAASSATRRAASRASVS